MTSLLMLALVTVLSLGSFAVYRPLLFPREHPRLRLPVALDQIPDSTLDWRGLI